VPKSAIYSLAAIAALLVGLSGGVAGAAEIKVLAAQAVQPALKELAPSFEKATGNKLKIEYATAGQISDKIAADADIDVAILTKPLADKLVSKAKLVGGTSANLAKAPIGLAVKKGAKKPDIGSVDALKKTLLEAKSVAYADPATGGASGVVVPQILEKLGIAAEVKGKTKLAKADPGQQAGDLVAKGQAEVGIQPVSILMGVKGVDVVGPLPAELQSADLLFVAASPMVSQHPLPAKALIDFLGKPESKQVLKAKGMEPS